MFDYSKYKEGDSIALESEDGVQNWRHAGRDEEGEIVVDGSPKYGKFRLCDLLGEPAEPRGAGKLAAPPRINKADLHTAEDAAHALPQASTPAVPTQQAPVSVPPTVKPV